MNPSVEQRVSKRVAVEGAPHQLGRVAACNPWAQLLDNLRRHRDGALSPVLVVSPMTVRSVSERVTVLE